LIPFLGWGRTVGGGSAAETLQQAMLPVAEHSACSSVNGRLVKVDEKSMVCAGGQGKGGCQVSKGFHSLGMVYDENNIPYEPTASFLRGPFTYKCLKQDLLLPVGTPTYNGWEYSSEILKRTPWRYQEPVLWAWLDFFPAPKGCQF